VIVVATTNSATNLDPRVGTDEASQKIHQLLFSPLVRIDTDLRVVPELAESIEQPDPVTYIARLRRGVRFHNGRELTSDDVVYTFRSFLDPAFKGRSGAYRVLASVNAIDRYTVAFTLKNPLGSFPVNLVMGIVQAGSGAANTRTPIGTGPYRLTEFVADDHVTVAAFDQYYGGRPRNDGVMLKVIPDDTMRGLELRNGSVDLIVNDLSPDIVWQLQEDGRVQVETAPGTDYAYIGLNLRDPVLSHLGVRKALGYAIDRDAIVKYLRRGFATTAVGIVPPMSWAFERDVFDFAHDPAEAERLLDAAGFPDPDGPGPLPRLRLSLRTSTTEVYRLQAAAIQHDLARVGVAIDIRSSEFQTLSADVLRGNFQMYTLQFVGVTDPDILRLVYHSQQAPPAGLNRVRYRNLDVDRLIEQAAGATDDRLRHDS
jgi:peptide/nickel transport system substrate-binding protein